MCKKDLGKCVAAGDCSHSLCSMKISCDGSSQPTESKTNNCVCHDGICMNHGGG